MQPATEVFIQTAVADEARVELNGLAEDGWEIFYQRLWQAAAPEKGQGKPSGSDEGAMIEHAGA